MLEGQLKEVAITFDNVVPASVAIGYEPTVLTRIYEKKINLTNYQRDLSDEIVAYCDALTEHKKHFNVRSVVPGGDIKGELNTFFPDYYGKPSFINDLSMLVEMYSCLFDLKEVGVRVQVLERAMCPRFHVDKLGCRLVSTYCGAGSEWLNEVGLDRSKLGVGSNGLPDNESGLYTGKIQQATAGDVLLLKGDGWFGNEGAAVVHRSPTMSSGERRLVVTMDFA